MALLPSGWGWPGKNPLIRFAASVDVDVPFEPEEINAVSLIYREIRAEFPRKNDQQILAVQVPQGGMMSPFHPVPRLGGVVFDRMQPDGTQSPILSVSGNRIFYQTSEYTRWHLMAPRINDLFAKVVDRLTAVRRVTALQLDFTNRFVFVGATAEARAADVLADNPYISSNALKCSDFWHSHHGFFDGSTSLLNGKWLRNLLVQVADTFIPDAEDPFGDDASPRRCLDISIIHRLHVGADADASVLSKDSSKTIADAFDQAREENRLILRKLVRPSVSHDIDGLVETRC